MNWEAVYHTLMPRLYNYFRYRLGNNDVAEDLTSTVFERAWQHRANYQDTLGNFEAWVFGIARNLVTDHLRQHRFNVVRLEDYEQLPLEYSVEKTVVQTLDLDWLRQAITTLTPREQELIALKYGAQFTNRQIAEMVDLSESNVGSILHRAIHKLRMVSTNEQMQEKTSNE